MSYRVISQKGYSRRDYTSLEEANAETIRMTRRTGINYTISQNPRWYDNMNNYTEDNNSESSFHTYKKARPEHEWQVLKIEINLTTEAITKSKFNFITKDDLIKFWRNNGVYYNEHMDIPINNRRGYKHEIMLGSTLIITIQTQIY